MHQTTFGTHPLQSKEVTTNLKEWRLGCPHFLIFHPNFMEKKYVRIHIIIMTSVHFQSFHILFTIPTKHIGNTKEISENTKEIRQSFCFQISDIKIYFWNLWSWGVHYRGPNGTFDTHIGIYYCWHLCHMLPSYEIFDIWQKYHTSIWVSKVP